MLSYFKFKDKISDEFGMVINKLPPITKPKKKTETVEIDGLNGDITIDNGYAAYDKQIQVTFLKFPDIDILNSWLTGSGQLVLSNEPDKYYDAEVFGEIAIEREKTFYTATITFHVQPYKHQVNGSVFTGIDSVTVCNEGIEDSLPVIKITGSGDVEVKIDGVTICTLTIDDEYIIMDSEKQDAYNGTTLKNRQMIGEFLKLPSGNTTITTTGTVTAIEVEPRSRWI